jgi:hypothetical protein
MEHDPLTTAIFLALYGVGIVWPLAILFRRAGKSGWWSAFAALLPLLPIALWVLAKSRWPASEAGSGRTAE